MPPTHRPRRRKYLIKESLNLKSIKFFLRSSISLLSRHSEPIYCLGVTLFNVIAIVIFQNYNFEIVLPYSVSRVSFIKYTLNSVASPRNIQYWKRHRLGSINNSYLYPF